MNLPQAISSCFKKYVTFSGRASRSEYWYFWLFCFLVGLITGILDIVLFGTTQGPDHTTSTNGVLNNIFALAILLPSISVGVRRLHDVDYSGWLMLIILIPILGALVLLFFFIKKGTAGDNRFGADPVNSVPAA